MSVAIGITPSIGDGTPTATLSALPTNLQLFVGGLLWAETTNYTRVGVVITWVTLPAIDEPIQAFGDGATSSAGSGLGYDTVAGIITKAAKELGLRATAIADPFADTDPIIVQLLALLESGGRDLCARRNWTHLRNEYTFATISAQHAYALPTDWRSMVPNSGWNRTTQFPLGGPVGSEYWQFRQAVDIASTLEFFVRIWQGQMWLSPTPTSAETIAYEYQSNFWVLQSGQTVTSLDAPTAASDKVCFKPLLALRRLKLDWKKEKGFDTTTVQDDYDQALNAAELEDSPASTIYLGGRRGQTPRKIDRWNIPDTGVGQ